MRYFTNLNTERRALALRGFSVLLLILMLLFAWGLTASAEIQSQIKDVPNLEAEHWRVTTFSGEMPTEIAIALSKGGFSGYECYSGTMLEQMANQNYRGPASNLNTQALVAMEKEDERVLVGMIWKEKEWSLSVLGEKALLPGREFTINASDSDNPFVWYMPIQFTINYPLAGGGSEIYSLSPGFEQMSESSGQNARRPLWYVNAYTRTEASGQGIAIMNIGGAFRVFDLPYDPYVGENYYSAYLSSALEYMDSIMDFPTSEAKAMRLAESSWARFEGINLAMAFGGVNLRQYPTTSSKSLGRVRTGTLVYVLGEEKGWDAPWYHVRVGREEGFISGIYLKFPKTDDFARLLSYDPLAIAKALDACTLRESPDANARSAKLPANTLMHVLADVDEGWLYVMIPRGDIGWEMDLDGTSGYVRASEVLQGVSIAAEQSSTTDAVEASEALDTADIYKARRAHRACRGCEICKAYRASEAPREPREPKEPKAPEIPEVVSPPTDSPASGIRRGAQYEASLQARRAIMKKYGFNADTIGLLAEDVIPEADGYTFTYSSVECASYYGVYTVRIQEGKAPVVTWSYDGVIPVQKPDDLSGPIWDAQQAAKFLEIWRVYNARCIEMYAENDGKRLSMEQLAELEKALWDLNVPLSIWPYLCALPGEDDLTPEQAVEAAKEAILKKYGVTADKLAQYTISLSFAINRTSRAAQYDVSFGLETDDGDSFYVEVQSPSGDIYNCYWYVNTPYSLLPEGPLDNYPEALSEFMSHNGMSTLTYEQKAKLYERIVAAGYQNESQIKYTMPLQTDLPEAEAITLAKAALLEKFGLTEEMLTLFEAQSSCLLDATSQTVWQIEFKPAKDVLWVFEDKLGIYTVQMNAADGAVLDARWSLSYIQLPPTGFSQSDFGKAVAWDASVLPWVLSLHIKGQRFEKICMETNWSPVSMARRDQLYRSAGFDPDLFSYGLPGPEDLTQEEALAIAKDVLFFDFGMNERELEDYFFNVNFDVSSTEHGTWRIFFSDNNTFYWVIIDGRTGEVTEAHYQAKAYG